MRIDSGKKESLETVAKLYGAPIVIVAEAGGLVLPKPLETRNLMRIAANRQQAEPEIPITDAGPGFIAEALSLTINTLHRFPGAVEKPEAPGMESTDEIIPDLEDVGRHHGGPTSSHRRRDDDERGSTKACLSLRSYFRRETG